MFDYTSDRTGKPRVIFRPVQRITVATMDQHTVQPTLTMGAADRSRQFAELLERHRGIVLKIAASYSREAHGRADLAQEIAAQLWRAFPRWDGARPFATWMYRIALNVAISSLRELSQRDRHDVPLDVDLLGSISDDGTAGENDERVRLLHRCIQRLDPLNRALLLLYLDERSHAEIADVLGLTETNVATKIGRLKLRLRNEMTEA
jgi:RNA polymerase sigma-70 factor (ECF subfamily)